MNSLERIALIRPTLSEDKIHVFMVKLDAFNPSSLYMALSKDEQTRADKLKVKEKKDQFIIIRAILRQLLSNVLNKELDEILFSYGQHCKPFIDDTYNSKSIEFNVSHSGDYGVIGLSLENKIGVDIEKVNSDIDYQSLANRFYSKAEKEQLATFDATERLSAFYRAWARKESYIKATGKGIAYGLDCFSLSLEKNPDDKQIQIKDNKEEKAYFYDLPVPENYHASLSCSNRAIELVLSQLV